MAAEGIEVRHGKGCRSLQGGTRCSCQPTYRASVWSNRDHKRIRKTFPNLAEAKGWRVDALSALSKGALRAPKAITVEQAWDAWYEAAKTGAVRNRSGDTFKPATLRTYETAMRLRLLDQFGSTKLTELRRRDVQDYADQLLADGLNPSTISTTLNPLRVMYRRAVSRGEVGINPCDGLELAAIRGRRERFATVEEADALIAAVPEADRPVWATAFFAGLRRGELMALRCEDVDLATGLLRVRCGWDAMEGEIALKSNAGQRNVPIPAALRGFLIDHKLRTGRESGRFFGHTAEIPLRPLALIKRADAAWKDAGLERITPHECRHTFASLMIAAGVNAKALSTFMGHANISITLDRYGHLMPGSEDEAAALMDDYLNAKRQEAEEKARAAAGDSVTPRGEGNVSRDNGGTMNTPSGGTTRDEAEPQTA